MKNKNTSAPSSFFNLELFGYLFMVIGLIGVILKLMPISLYQDNETQCVFLAILTFGCAIVSMEETIIFFVPKMLLETTRFSFKALWIEPVIFLFVTIMFMAQAYGVNLFSNIVIFLIKHLTSG